MKSTTVVCERSVAVSSTSSYRAESTRSVRLEASYSGQASPSLLGRASAALAASRGQQHLLQLADSDDEAWDGHSPLRFRRPVSAAALAIGSPLSEDGREWRTFVSGLEERHSARQRLCEGPTGAGEDRRPALLNFRSALLEVSALDCQLARNLQQLSAGLAQLRRSHARRVRQRAAGSPTSRGGEDDDTDGTEATSYDGDVVDKEAAMSKSSSPEAAAVRIDVVRQTTDDDDDCDD